MRIIIVGAGLGGLLCSIQLRKLGHNVQVLERRNELSNAGGVIMLSGSASRILNSIDLGEGFARICRGVTQSIRRDLKDGNVLQANLLTNGDKITTWAALRPDLINVFHDQAVKLGVQIRFGSKVVDVVDDAERPQVVLSCGQALSADLIIAADGASSQIRRHVLAPLVSDPKVLDPIVSDRVAYLAVYDNHDFLRHALSATDPTGTIVASPAALQFFSGAEKRYIISLYQAESDSFSMLFASTEGNASMDGLYDERGDVAYVRERFGGVCHPEVERALHAAKAFQRWQIAEVPSLPQWRSQSNRIILLGDAAHAMHPTAGHGFSSTVSDIAVLSLILDRYEGAVDKVAEATRLWEQACRPRDERIKDYAHFQSLMLEGDPSAVAHKRKHLQREQGLDLSNVQGDMNAEFGSPEFVEWFRRYDAVAEAQTLLQIECS